MIPKITPRANPQQLTYVTPDTVSKPEELARVINGLVTSLNQVLSGYQTLTGITVSQVDDFVYGLGGPEVKIRWKNLNVPPVGCVLVAFDTDKESYTDQVTGPVTLRWAYSDGFIRVTFRYDTFSGGLNSGLLYRVRLFSFA